MKATVSEKGQVTIPKALRNRLGIRPGAVLEFEAAASRRFPTPGPVRFADRRSRGRQG